MNENELFSVRNPAELYQEAPQGYKAYFSSFDPAIRYMAEKIWAYRDIGGQVIFTPIKTEIDGVEKNLWRVQVNEYSVYEGIDDDF